MRRHLRKLESKCGQITAEVSTNGGGQTLTGPCERCFSDAMCAAIAAGKLYGRCIRTPLSESAAGEICDLKMGLQASSWFAHDTTECDDT